MSDDPIREAGARNVPVLSGVWTDAHGLIVNSTPDAAQLLGRSRRSLVGRSMLLFVSANREHVRQAVGRASLGHNETLDLKLLPSGRARVDVRVHLQSTTLTLTGAAVLWALERRP
jgi:nitrogen-specific signal transduction histidine kinase